MKASVILELVNKFSRPSKQVRDDLGLMEKGTGKLKQKLDQLRNSRPEKVAERMSQTADKASRAAQKLASKEQAIHRIKQRQIQQERRLTQLAHRRAIAQQRQAAAELKSIERVRQAKERMKKYGIVSAAVAGTGAAGVYAGKRALGGMFNMTNSIRPEEKAKGELATMGIQNMGVIVAKAREMQSKVAGITSDVFLTAAYDIKSGISTLTDQGVAAQTASAGYVAKATKANIMQMTSLFATGYGIYKQQFTQLNDEQFGARFGASLVGAVQTFKTNGSAMQQAIESAGSDATLLGQKMSETFSILGMLQQKMSAGEAGTALKSFSENAGNAHEKFTKFAKTTKNPVAVRILDKNNMLREMPDILTDLKARYGDTLDAMESREIASAFGSSEAVKTIKSLWNQEAALKANTIQMEKLAGQGDKYSQSVAKLAGKNWDDKLVLQQQKVALLKLELSEKLIPTMTRLLPYIDNAVTGVRSWIQEHPELVKYIAMGAAGLAVTSTAIGGLLLAIAPLLLGMYAMRLGFAMIGLKGGLVTNVLRLLWGTLKVGGRVLMFLGRTALPLVLTVIRSIAMALLANPIGLAIAVIAGGAYLIYKNWDKLVSWWNSWTLHDVGYAVGQKLGQTAVWLKQKWQTFTAWWAGISYKDILLVIPLNPITAIYNLAKSFFNWWNGIPIKEKKVTVETSAIDTAWSKAKGFLGWWQKNMTLSGNLGKVRSFTAGVAKGFNDGGARATGGPVHPGNFYRVNERGPELLNIRGQSYLMATQAGHVSPLISKFNGGLQAANSPLVSAPTLRAVDSSSIPKTTSVAQPQSTSNSHTVIKQGSDTYNVTFNVSGDGSQSVQRQVEQAWSQIQRRQSMRRNGALYDGTNG